MRKLDKSWRWLFAVVFGLVLWSFCVVSLVRATKKLADLTKITSTLDSISIEQSTGKAQPYYVVFDLYNTTQRLGILMGSDEDEAKKLVSNFRKGDTLTVYFDATGLTVERGVNLFTYQAQNQHKIIYSLADAQRRQWSLTVMSGTLALLFSLVLVVSFYKEIAK